MSHYPSSAELAAFRRSIPHPAPNPFRATDEDIAAERKHGIGFRRVAGTDGGTLNGDVYLFPWDRVNGRVIINTECRREASAMRSRAYSTSMVHGSVPCYHCGERDFHAYSCPWNIGPKSA